MKRKSEQKSEQKLEQNLEQKLEQNLEQLEFILQRDKVKTKFIVGEFYFLLTSFTSLLWISYFLLNNDLLLLGYISCQFGITLSFFYLIKWEKGRINKMNEILDEVRKERIFQKHGGKDMFTAGKTSGINKDTTIRDLEDLT